MAFEMTPMSGKSAVDALATNEGKEEKRQGVVVDDDFFDDDGFCWFRG